MDNESKQPPAQVVMEEADRLPEPQECPMCHTQLQRKLFRTGSVQHPGRDMLVCPRCGTKK